jgi:hypothetical protein
MYCAHDREEIVVSTDYVYGLMRPDNGGVFYIGMGTNNRAWDHQKARKKGRSYKDNVICKMIDELGYPEIPVIMFQTGLSHKEACELEQSLIRLIGRQLEGGPLTNVHPGGQGWETLSIESRAKIAESVSLSKKGKPSPKKGRPDDMSPEKRAQWREIMKGRTWYTDGTKEVSLQAGASPPPGWQLGRLNVSPETKAKMALAKRGKPLTEDHKRKIGDTNRGQKRAHFDSSWWSSPEGQAHAHKIWITDGLEETRILPSDPIPTGWMRGRMIKGRPAHNKGKPMSEETRKKISLGHKARHLPPGVH